MDPITIVEGDDLNFLKSVLADLDAATYSLRFHQTADGQIKVKVNAYTWTPGLGKLDA